MQYVVATTLRRALECSLLVATSDRLILCQEKKLQLLDFDGRLEREWVFDATVRYIKVTGGPAGGEGALIGLKDGTIVKIFVDQPFPVTVVKHARAASSAWISPGTADASPRWTTTASWSCTTPRPARWCTRTRS